LGVSAVEVHVLTEQEIMVEGRRRRRDPVPHDEVPDELLRIQVIAGVDPVRRTA